jgi:hypothetical protein
MADAVVEEHVEVYFSIACQTGNMVQPLVYDCLKMGEPSGLGACCVQQKRLVLLETLRRLRRRRRPSLHSYHYYRRQPLFSGLSNCNFTWTWQSFVRRMKKTMRICLPAANLRGLI